MTPDSNVRHEFSHVGSQAAHIVLPRWSLAVNIEVLLEDGSPLVAADVFFDSAQSLRRIHTRQIKLIGKLHVRLKLLVGLVIAMV